MVPTPWIVPSKSKSKPAIVRSLLPNESKESLFEQFVDAIDLLDNLEDLNRLLSVRSGQSRAGS